mmetsp:Transcript_1845/g.2763  ORF Transcript_1845/g.2763 Transcript_1845/m.2763 type:complete len:285 (-) Transcript_1845:1320-2174(-)
MRGDRKPAVALLSPKLDVLPQATRNDTTFPDSYISNPLGEIRATAREFVPSFAPAPPVPEKTLLKPTKQAAAPPPGLGLDPPVLTSKRDPEPSYSILPPTTVAGLESSSILPSLDRNRNPTRTFSAPPMGLDRSGHSHGSSLHQSAATSATSSIAGISIPVGESNFMPNTLGSNENREEEFVSSLLDPPVSLDAATTGAPMASLTPLDAGGATAPLSGSSIWGGGTTSASNNIGGLPTFNYPQNPGVSSSFTTNDTGSSKNDQNNESLPNTWGSFGPTSNGSIW